MDTRASDSLEMGKVLQLVGIQVVGSQRKARRRCDGGEVMLQCMIHPSPCKCWERAEAAERELSRQLGWIASEGYVRCDIPACNCPWWHRGHAHERLRELGEVLWVNGETALASATKLVAERDALQARVEKLEEIIRRDRENI
jgi:hypothetical protein